MSTPSPDEQTAKALRWAAHLIHQRTQVPLLTAGQIAGLMEAQSIVTSEAHRYEDRAEDGPVTTPSVEQVVAQALDALHVDWFSPTDGQAVDLLKDLAAEGLIVVSAEDVRTVLRHGAGSEDCDCGFAPCVEYTRLRAALAPFPASAEEPR